MKRVATAYMSSSILFAIRLLFAGDTARPASAADDATLPAWGRAVWDVKKAHREATPTRERICINGLWRWQPAGTTNEVPTGGWGYFKVPGCWPGVSDYMQHDCQTVYAHPSWKDARLGEIAAAWYQREITVPMPKDWAGRRVILCLEYLNSSATVFVDGKRVGEAQFPAGEVDLTSACPPGTKHVLSLLVAAKPLGEVMLRFSDTNAARRVRGSVQRRGLCGDVYIDSVRPCERIADVKIDTSVRKGQITLNAALENLAPRARYTLHAVITDRGSKVREFSSKSFGANDLHAGRFTLTEKWKPENLWDIHTPQHVYEVGVSLVHENGEVLDVALPVRFGFREFWIDGRDFYLNGTRIFLSALPLDNAQVSALAASYAGAKESLLRLKKIGINFVYTHNYGCEPGSHLSFEEILRAADDVGMLVALSQPHFAQYDWQMSNASEKNGYAHHARSYCRVAGNHPSVVFYSMSHNSTGYDEDMNPEMIDGIHSPRSQWAANNVKRALLAEAIVVRLDPGRIVYHHSSGNLSSMHTSNFYTNMAPAQELDDWFEHWATKGVKPLFTCEYMVPCTWDWTMYRGWYKGKREFGSARVPWEFCVAEWSSQFLGDRAYRISEAEKRNLRWEAEQFRNGRLWHRWDYPNQVGSTVFDPQHEIIGAYLNTNWRAFRTWGVSAISPWEYHFFWTLRKGVDKSRKELKVDWDNLQRPGFSADYIDRQYERMDLAFQPSDWIPTADGQAILRNNQPLLAYIGGKPAAFTSKDHNFYPGETVEKQLILINNSRETVTADCRWSFGGARFQRELVGNVPHDNFLLNGSQKATIATGQQERIRILLPLPVPLPQGEYDLSAEVHFTGGEVQKDRFTVHVMTKTESPQWLIERRGVDHGDDARADQTALPPGPSPARRQRGAKIAVFDPKGETLDLLQRWKIEVQPVKADADLAAYEILIIGKGALTAQGPGPNLGRVRDGLKVLVFEQTSEALEKRLGFRVAEYGLRQVFGVADLPYITENLRDWRGSATLLPPRLDYFTSQTYHGPAVRWCGIEVPRVWRCGNRGNVASVLIEKPARGDFLPILDGGYSLQYSPWLEYREGKGLVLFCQLDVTGRTEQDPAAERLASNMVASVLTWQDYFQRWRKAVYVGEPAGKRHLEFSGIPLTLYDGQHLDDEHVLIVGRGAGPVLTNNREAIQRFIYSNGHVLALGLDKSDAIALVSPEFRMTKAEHIASPFKLSGDASTLANIYLAGVGPADLHNRDPREVFLVADRARAEIFGNGVLACARRSNVVFLQFPPYLVTNAKGEVPSQLNLRRTYRRTSFALTRLLANMGVAAPTPLLSRFSTPVGEGRPKRWLQGLYLDQPEAWDDPYRFFRW